MIRVLIADDQKLVRDGIRVLIARAPDIELIGEARNGQEAVDLARESQPDVVLMDVRMPQRDGLAATLEITATGARTRVLMVAMQYDEATVRQALQNGATGFVAKSEMYSVLPAAIRLVAGGGCYHSPSVAKLLLAAAVR